MPTDKQDERRWPTPLKPVLDDNLDIYDEVELMDPAIHKNNLVELVINMTGSTKRNEAEHATFGAGCFWHVEDVFRNIPGVTSTQAGYMGGTRDNPTYEEVCTGRTGHTEVVEITYDPATVSYDHLLDVFWNIHDPTQVNRQGPDVGIQYRSVIFFHGQEQEKAAIASRDRIQKSFNKPIATSIEHAKIFYRAEEYHQQYFDKTGKKSCGI